MKKGECVKVIWLIIVAMVVALTVTIVPSERSYAATQATYYVNPSGGSDSNNGLTTGTAFATIAKARDVIRTINGSMTGDIYVYLMNGTYPLSSTLTFGTSDSGTNGYQIIYKNYTGATPIVSGGVDLTTGWTLHDAGQNIYKKTGVNWNFRQLYVNDSRGVKARKPNLTDEATGGPYLNATNSSYPYTVNASDIGSWANGGTAEMVVVGHWSQHRGRIASYSGNTVSFKSPESGFAYNHHNQGSSPYFFENAYELLDAAGEWFLDTAASTLYYKPRSGETMNTTTVIAPKVETLIQFQGSSGTSKVHDIQFVGITFKYSNWLAPSSYGYVDSQAGFRYQSIGGGSNSEIRNTARYSSALGMVQLKYASTITLEANVFQFAGGWGIMGNEGTDHTLIKGNSFYKNAGGGIALGVAGDQWDEQTAMDGQSTYDSIMDNTIDSGGLDYADMVGIGAMVPNNMTIGRNEVKNLPYTGITIGWNWQDYEHGMTDNIVFGNNIHHVVRLLDDGGGIYTLGKMVGFTRFDANYIHDLSGSVYNGGYPISAIYFDNGSAYKTAEKNVINNAPQTIFASNPPNHDNVIQNNYSNSPWGNWSGSNVFQGNTTVSNQSWPQGAIDIMNSVGPGGSAQKPTPPTAPPPGPVVFSDNFNDNTIGTSWTTYGGAWSETSQTLKQTSTANGDPRKAIVSNGGLGTSTDYTITAKVRVDNWTDGDYARAGVGLFTGTSDGKGYNLVFHQNHSTIQWLNDEIAWGTSYPFTWSNNTWYWFKMSASNGTLYGKVWQDGTSEPASWMYSQSWSGRTGYPSLNGGSTNTGGSTASFDDITVEGPASTNKALNKTVNAYYIDGSTAALQPGDSVVYATDGNASTKTQATDQWRWMLRVDLGASASINRIKVIMPATAYATAFDIQTSTDGTSYTTVKSVTGFGGGASDNTITATTARYVRVVAITPNGPGQTGGQMAISEVEVY
ncbi:discoidin domain-containing protein [Paenibacillus sp. CF384]|uniref:discoidin domain-containing protein n=1 Tax=Paenibacillus sp. CF384 TaxID=1884382 RepID=UPI0008999B96|nr:discoidin domain-containing protein [Paenibacillus sp. CF384]SDX48958.1 Right handed beta helix region [Paenibacillus sp. CF384]